MNAFVKERSLILELGVMNCLLISIAAAALVLYVRWRNSRKHLYELGAKVPIPDCAKSLPILGHSLYFIGDTERILNNVKYISTNCESPGTIWLAHRLFFLLTTPADLEIALNSPKSLEKDDLYRFSRSLAGKGLFSLEVDAWKVHRKLITPTFHPRILDSFVNVFVEQSNVLVEILQGKVHEMFNIGEHLTAATLEMVTQTAMGVKLNKQLGNCKLGEQLNRGLEIMFMRMFNVPLHFDFIFELSGLAKEERGIIDSFLNFIKKVINDKKVEKKLKMLETEAEIDDIKKRKVFLDHLLELSEQNLLTEEEIIDEVRTFMIGGSDTSATVISFVLVCLGMFPEYQQKVYEEVIDVIGYDRDIECEDIPKFKYLEMCIKETMRLFPIGPNIVRKVTEDLQIGDHMLPEGSGLVLCIYTVHRNDKYFPDHMRFDPERFSPEECAKRHPYAYLPFAGGPRNCIGMKFGYNMMKIVLATLVRKFFIETSFQKIEDIRVKQSLIIKSILGYPVKLTPRNSDLI
ncbi:PREDICTED: cytochrome P450 4C1-like [Nicrophorus vespilloides]|uniref:Cytochrome P450 4C1-like n=1 Tax=Nicrophorus vespilloides TaxID=110193 RepID=A0ABM1MPF2_NICVS|nr:PREDICTED: cytochrome P450 4C1-like [Nicrophorus vespilloides]